MFMRAVIYEPKRLHNNRKLKPVAKLTSAHEIRAIFSSSARQKQLWSCDCTSTGETLNYILSVRVPRFSVRTSIIPGHDTLDVSSIFLTDIYTSIDLYW